MVKWVSVLGRKGRRYGCTTPKVRAVSESEKKGTAPYQVLRLGKSLTGDCLALLEETSALVTAEATSLGIEERMKDRCGSCKIVIDLGSGTAKMSIERGRETGSGENAPTCSKRASSVKVGGSTLAARKISSDENTSSASEVRLVGRFSSTSEAGLEGGPCQSKRSIKDCRAGRHSAILISLACTSLSAIMDQSK